MDGTEPDEWRQRPAGALFGSPYLFLLGRDVCRWTKQCMEWSRSKAGEGEPALAELSFARMLVESPPAGVGKKPCAGRRRLQLDLREGDRAEHTL